MKLKAIIPFFVALFLSAQIIIPEETVAQVQVTIQAGAAKRPVSQNIYGKNNSLSNWFSNPLKESDFQFLRDAGLRMFRESGGNNSTKYNWRRKLSSHPDWYNNVYSQDWDYSARTMLEKIPGSNGMWTLPLIGKAAKTGAANFNDWSYNGSQLWDGVHQNLAGGGTINTSGGGKALMDGNPDLYLENWPPDSVVGILNKWFGSGGLGYDRTRIPYWNMDNEPEIWDGTHDDVMPVMISAEEFMQRYIETAKKARQLFPDIKLAGPVPANEWQWYNWKGGKVLYGGVNYTWLEYFIKRIADEQKVTGIRLLDILDIHFYPGETKPEDIVQLHRVFFDRNYTYPGANGVKRISASGWDNSITKEYIFGRCSEWLLKYMGPGHGVTFAVSETGVNTSDANVRAVWYASTLGEFAKQGVEVFTPWDWKVGQWEVLHLFSRYNKPYFVDAISGEELYVSAYPTSNLAGDSMTMVLINRHTTLSKDVKVSLNSYELSANPATYLRLNGLTSTESFKSHTVNALKSGSVLPANNSFTLSLPPLSVTSLQFTGKVITVGLGDLSFPAGKLLVYPNPVTSSCTIRWPELSSSSGMMEVISITGQLMENRMLDSGEIQSRQTRLITESWSAGTYFVRIRSGASLYSTALSVVNPR